MNKVGVEIMFGLDWSFESN